MKRAVRTEDVDIAIISRERGGQRMFRWLPGWLTTRGVGVESPAVSAVLFHPRVEQATGGLEVTTTAVDGAILGGLWREKGGTGDVVVFFHGNGETAADWAEESEELSEAFGASVWLVDYRGYGRSTGQPRYGTMLADAEVLWRALGKLEKRRGRPFRRRYVMGRSLGSAAAIHLAWRYGGEVHGLVVESGFARLPALVEWLGDRHVHVGLPRGFRDNVDKLRACRMPTLFLHGEDDRIIPVAAARENWAASGAAYKWLEAVAGAGHNDLFWKGGEQYLGAIRRLAEI